MAKRYDIMKYRKDEILYFKPSYSEQNKYCRICQIVKYLENKRQYLAIVSDIYCPFHYCKCFIYEEDLGNIQDTFLINEITIEKLYIKLSLDEVMKLQYYDIYQEVKRYI